MVTHLRLDDIANYGYDGGMSCSTEPIMSTLRARLVLSRGSWVGVARDSGVPYHTLVKIAQGRVANPRVATVQRLLDHFNSLRVSEKNCATGGTEDA